MGTSIIAQWFSSKAACSLYEKDEKKALTELSMEK